LLVVQQGSASVVNLSAWLGSRDDPAFHMRAIAGPQSARYPLILPLVPDLRSPERALPVHTSRTLVHIRPPLPIVSTLPISRVAVRHPLRAPCLPNLFKMNIFRVTLVFALLLGVALLSAPDYTIATSVAQRCYSDKEACLHHRKRCIRCTRLCMQSSRGAGGGRARLWAEHCFRFSE